MPRDVWDSFRNVTDDALIASTGRVFCWIKVVACVLESQPQDRMAAHTTVIVPVARGHVAGLYISAKDLLRYECENNSCRRPPVYHESKSAQITVRAGQFVKVRVLHFVYKVLARVSQSL
ncbi:hypothetical protein llap_16837 [Limosa lapponica baueri]|uniref:Uncharacterized protein n=1 Tax=Limosa lapponica baueri TaxID=1758121 RepID=A0A2I0TGD7_LIMLA|nr:hypothetical protein llap_16837 [Limosa lapponica baueri]